MQLYATVVWLRYNDLNMTVAPTLPGDATRLTLSGLYYRGAELRVSAAASQITIACGSGCAPPLCASMEATGEPRKKELVTGVEVEFPTLATVTIEPGPCQVHGADYGAGDALR